MRQQNWRCTARCELRTVWACYVLLPLAYLLLLPVLSRLDPFSKGTFAIAGKIDGITSPSWYPPHPSAALGLASTFFSAFFIQRKSAKRDGCQAIAKEFRHSKRRSVGVIHRHGPTHNREAPVSGNSGTHLSYEALPQPSFNYSKNIVTTFLGVHLPLRANGSFRWRVCGIHGSRDQLRLVQSVQSCQAHCRHGRGCCSTHKWVGRTDPASREFWQPRGARSSLGSLSDGIRITRGRMSARDRALELPDVLRRCDAAVRDPVVVPLLYSLPRMADRSIFGRRVRTRVCAVGEHGCSLAPAGHGGAAEKQQQDHRVCA